MPQGLAGLVARVGPEEFRTALKNVLSSIRQPANYSQPTAATSSGLASLVPNQFARSIYFDPNNPFSAGQNLNTTYGEQYRTDTGNVMPDMQRYGGRYANELSTAGGRLRLGNDIGYAAQNTGQTGFYRPQDFNPLTGFENLNDPNVIKNYASYFPQGNSYFIPDKVEADPYQFAYHGFTADSMSKPDQDAAFNAMYGGRTLVNNAGFNSGGSENLMRELLNAKSNPRHFTPDINRDLAYNNVLTKSAGLLAGMDVGRGNITTEQGQAIDKAAEWTRNLAQDAAAITNIQNELNARQRDLANLTVRDGNTETYNQLKASYETQIPELQNRLARAIANQQRTQETLNPHLATTRTITDPTALSSAEVIKLLTL